MQLADERLALQHALCPQREGNCHNGGQRFGNGGHGQTHSRQQHLLESLPKHNAPNKYDDDKRNCANRQPFAQLVQPLLQGCGLFDYILEHGGNVAQFSLHARTGDEHLTTPVVDDGAGIDHIAPIAQGQAGIENEGRVLFHRLRFAGEGGFHGAHVEAAQDAPVGRHHIAGLEDDHVAGDEAACIHIQCAPATAHAHCGH